MQRTLILALALCLALSGCGFKLRNSWAMPYESLYLDFSPYSEFGAQLKRTLRGSPATRITDRAEDAEAILQPTGEARERKIITYSAGGRVREIQLVFRYSFRVVDRKHDDLIEPVTITMSRDMSYDETRTLAKSAEEDLLWRDMMNDLTQQIMRQLAGTPRQKRQAEGGRTTAPSPDHAPQPTAVPSERSADTSLAPATALDDHVGDLPVAPTPARP